MALFKSAVFALTVIPSVCVADVWAAFMDHCLAPMERAENVLSDGFVPHGQTGDTELFIQSFKDFDIIVGQTRQGPFVPQTCTIDPRTDARHAAVKAGFLMWRESVLASGAYVLADQVGGRLSSTDQREPLIEVLFVEKANGKVIMLVTETNLES